MSEYVCGHMLVSGGCDVGSHCKLPAYSNKSVCVCVCVCV